MKTINLKTFLYTTAVAVLFTLIPVANTHAYTILEEKVYPINDTMVLLTQKFSFSVINSDAYLSYLIRPTDADSVNSLDKAMQFSVFEAGKRLTGFDSIGLLFSHATNINGLYQVTKRNPTEFTLAVFVTVPPSATPLAERDISLQLTKLPFTVFAENSVRQFFYPLPNDLNKSNKSNSRILTAPAS